MDRNLPPTQEVAPTPTQPTGVASQPTVPPPEPMAPTPAQPPVEPKSASSKLLTKLAMVFLGLAFLGLVGSLVKNYVAKRKEVACTMEAKMCPDGTAVGRVPPKCDFAPCSTPSATPDLTANWKSHINKQAGFSLEYPPEYSSEEVNVGPNDKRVDFKATNTKISNFSVHVSPAKLPQYPYDQNPTGVYTLGGYQGLYIELPNGYSDAGESNPPPRLAIFIQKGNILYSINFIGTSNLSDVLVSQILSTFKFLDSVEGYTCPETEWIDCTPGLPEAGIKWQCTDQYLDWAKENCPAFKGANF